MALALERIASKARSRQYTDVNEAMADLATALSSQGKLASFGRGIDAGVIAGQSGGTTLDVGDPSAGRISKSLQPPQKGVPLQQGALQVRMQANVEIDTKTVPALVIDSGFYTVGTQRFMRVHAVLAGDQPYLAKDALTNQNVANVSPFTQLSNTQGKQTEINIPVGADQTAISGGSIINVFTTKQFDVRTIWTNKEGRRIPVVKRTQTVDDKTLVVQGTTTPIQTCTPLLLSNQAMSYLFSESGGHYPPDPATDSFTVSLFPWQGNNIASPNSYWRILETSVASPGGNYGGQGGPFDHYPWGGAGRIDANGKLLGLPDDYHSNAALAWEISFSGDLPPKKLFSKGFLLQTGCGGQDNLVHWHVDTGEFFYNTTSPTSDFP